MKAAVFHPAFLCMFRLFMSLLASSSSVRHWMLVYRRHIRKLDQFHMRRLRHQIAHIKWQDKVPNTEVLQRCQITGIAAFYYKCTSPMDRTCHTDGQQSSAQDDNVRPIAARRALTRWSRWTLTRLSLRVWRKTGCHGAHYVPSLFQGEPCPYYLEQGKTSQYRPDQHIHLHIPVRRVWTDLRLQDRLILPQAHTSVSTDLLWRQLNHSSLLTEIY